MCTLCIAASGKYCVLCAGCRHPVLNSTYRVQSVNSFLNLVTLASKHALVQLDQLQEGLGGGVVVSLLHLPNQTQHQHSRKHVMMPNRDTSVALQNIHDPAQAGAEAAAHDLHKSKQCARSITSRNRLDCALTAAKLYGMNSTTAALMASLPSSTSSRNFLATLQHHNMPSQD